MSVTSQRRAHSGSSLKVGSSEGWGRRRPRGVGEALGECSQAGRAEMGEGWVVRYPEEVTQRAEGSVVVDQVGQEEQALCLLQALAW